jgi:glycosyltransferase involved in cell wall biosynthesis
MDKKVLVLADPTSIHTKKWMDGWKFIGYQPVLSGLSDRVSDNKLIFNEHISVNGGNGIKYIKNIFNFYKVLKRENPTIINAHSMSSYGLVSALIKKKKHTLVLFLPGSDIMIDMNRNLIYTFMSKFVLNRADILVSVSDTMTKRLLEKNPTLESKILTQQYGVDTKFLNNFFKDEKEIDIISNRQWKPNSNYPIILKALSSFTKKKIKLIGNDNSLYANKILNYYNGLFSSSIGIVSYEENLSYVGSSKVFISFTSSDGIPLSLIEAMYLGAIPIVSDIEPNRELIQDGINGFIVSLDSNKLKIIINKVLALDKNIIKSIQDYNKKLVLDKFDFEKNFKKLNSRLK